MEANLVIEGFKFMVLGMGTVFLFLIVLIVLMNIMSAFLDKFFPEPKPIIPSIISSVTKEKNNKNIIAAITAAVIHHRKG